MRKFNPFRSKKHHESSHRTATTTTSLRIPSKPLTGVISRITEPTYPITISAPIINTADKVVINDRDQSEDIPAEEQPTTVENDNIEEQIAVFEQPEKMSDEYNHPDEQPVSSLSTSSNQSSPSTKKIESIPASAMVGNNPKEELLTSCKATAMIYNDSQKKWIHCASNGPAKIQLLFNSESQSYRIVGRQIQDHEVVLNHSIVKGIKYNQATPTFHQWRDQSGVYGLNFASKLDAQEFGGLMTQILESVNGATNLSSRTNANGGATLPSSTANNNNNNNTSTTTYKRQPSQPSSSLPPTAPTVSINSTSSTSSSSVSEPTQQQQQHSSSPYNNQLRINSNSTNSAPVSASNNYYSQHPPSAEEDDTNYALISDSYTSYGDNSTNKNNTIPPAPPLNLPMSATGSAPPPPGPPPPPPPPPLPGGFGGPPPAPALVLPTANGNNGANAARKPSAATTAGPMDLMSEMAAKFAQRRKNVDETDKPDSSNAARVSPKPASTLPAATAAPVQTSPRAARKAGDSQPSAHYTSSDLEKLKSDILTEVRKDIEKAKQEILAAILEQQKSLKK